MKAYSNSTSSVTIWGATADPLASFSALGVCEVSGCEFAFRFVELDDEEASLDV